jgi:predicted nucleic acid-binding protein
VTFVLDASITLAWCFEDQSTSLSELALERLREERALVPEVWPFEVANVLAGAERWGRLTWAQSARFVRLLRQLPITVEQLGQDTVMGTGLALSRRHGLTAYDAAYLVLAAGAGVPLATADLALRRAAGAAGVALLAVTAES